MGEVTSSWRVFPEKVPVQLLLRKGERAEACLDFVAAGHWYFHAKRKGSAEGWERAEGLRTRFEVLAEQGNLDAKVLLAGLLLARGEQLPLAVSMLETAAAGSVPEGMRGLGFLLTRGLGVPADPQRANDMYLAAAELGDGYAAFNLAVNFYQGNGTGRNYRKFFKWLEAAGSLGIPEAWAMLGSQCAKKVLNVILCVGT
ncbi:tetratricopeptide repeat protein [Streptomyces sp. SID11385]|uniref:tetratricopeptide repeat protein n=1 Tax=Streptomyces sp. SID11385 TaxID=2706031 RepID=UPI0013CD0025|nr:tetratricopeptide repeat protein [Streptomyces sp. SID11385]NEA38811.1 sel1 repeat family protein [Streptomyces sp. SID11385]